MMHQSPNSISEVTLNSSLKRDWFQVSITLSNGQIRALLKSLSEGVFFDSGADCTRGQFDILSGNPASVERADKNNNTSNSLTSNLPIYSTLFKRTRLNIPKTYQHLPFICGIIGFCSYEYGAQKTINQTKLLTESKLPHAFFGHYTWSYVYDRTNKQGVVTFSPDCLPNKRYEVIKHINSSLKNANTTDKSFEITNWQKQQNFEKYHGSFKRTLDYIKAGDCYQVNLAQRFECDYKGNPTDLYFSQRKNINTPYSCFFSFSKDQHILSFSPEQFIGIQAKKIKTSPIKGTAQNSNDKQSANNLKNSLKNKAENLMIVDLMRNDLSKVCQLNSIKVNELFKLETFRNVHHLVSEIEGVLKPEYNEIDAFFSCFPGGSITGAPKKRAMEIINELEESGRDAYCGSVFYWNDDGQFDSNILIRTIVHSEDKLYCWGGGGIVHDSVVEDEYKESLIKVANLTGIES